MTEKCVAHFQVTHPLGMHARVCSRWIKTLIRIRPMSADVAHQWAWLGFSERRVVADSLFQLLETRIPCGAEFDLILEESVPFDADVEQELREIISLEAFELTA